MKPIRPWLAASQPGRALLAPLCVAVGSAYAHFDAHRGPVLSHVVASLAALAAGLGVHLIDHAWERLGAPPPDPKKPVPEALVPVDARESAIAGSAAIAVAALCGIGLAPLSGSAALGYGAVAVALGILRGMPVVGLETLGWGLGEVAPLLALGPLAALAGFASQTGSGSGGAFLAGLPAGLAAGVGLFGTRGLTRNLDADAARGVRVALPLFAVAAVVLAVRAGEYGSFAYAAAVPLVGAAGIGLRLPPRSDDEALARWERPVLICAAAALIIIIASLWLAPPR